MGTSSTLCILFHSRVCWEVNSTSLSSGLLSKDNEENLFKINAILFILGQNIKPYYYPQ